MGPGLYLLAPRKIKLDQTGRNGTVPFLGSSPKQRSEFTVVIIMMTKLRMMLINNNYTALDLNWSGGASGKESTCQCRRCKT